MLRHLVGHLVALQNVRERVQAEAQRIRHVHQHVDLVLAVAVARHESLLPKDLQQRLQFQIHTWRQRSPAFPNVLALGAAEGGPVLELRHAVLTCPDEVVVVNLLHAHARLWEAASVPVAPIALLHVLPEGKLDERHRILEQQFPRLGPPPKFHNGALAPDGVRRAVEDLGARHPAGQLAVHVDVLAVDRVANPHFRAARLGSFVHPAVHGDVRVLVDHAGGHVFALGIQLHRHDPCGQQLRRIELGPHGHEFAFVDQYVGAVEHPLFLARPHRRVADPHGLRFKPVRRAVRSERVDNPGQVQSIFFLVDGFQFRDFGDVGTFLFRLNFLGVWGRGFVGVSDGGPIDPSSVGGLA